MLKTTLLIASLSFVALAQAQTTNLLGSTFENVANGASIASTAFTSGTVGGTWQSFASGSTFVGSTAQANGGTTSGLLTRSTTTGYGYFWGDLNGGNDLTYAVGQTFTGSADFFLPASGTTATNGAIFGMEAYGGGGANFYGGVYLYGGTTYGNVPFIGDGAGNLYYAYDSAGTQLTYTKGAWNNLSVHMTYTAADTVVESFYLNGSLLYDSDGTTTSPFTITYKTADGDIGVSDFDVATNYITASKGSAYVDNFSVKSIVPVPEPASLAALGLGAAALLRRRRKA